MRPASPRQRATRLFLVKTIGALLGIAGLALAPILAAPPPRRARPPEFSKSIRDLFFPDAREKLRGARPTLVPRGEMPAAASPSTPDETPPPVAAGWSRWIAAETVEDEIKRRQIELAEAVRDPLRFNAGDFRKARGHLSVLAVMFAVAAEYDGRIRWQREAASVRDLLSRAASNCKVGTDATYNEAKTRSDDLQTLVRGGSLQLEKDEGSPEVSWPRVADRAPLMQRLERARQEGVEPGLANQRDFERTADEIAGEAELIAALAEVITREGYEFADDETYLEHARAMQAEALSVRDAARQNNYEQARRAAGELGKACSNCHEGYRG